jgi:hypothetical protein
MSQSAPNSRAPSPPPVPSISRGGSRPESGRRSKKRRKAEAANAVGNAVQDALRQHRRRLAEGISSLSNPSGRSLSSNELRIIIRLALWLQLHEDYSEDAAIKAASVWSGSGHMTVGPAYHHWWETGELLEPDTSQQGSGNPQHPRHVSSVSFEAILAIHQALADA